MAHSVIPLSLCFLPSVAWDLGLPCPLGELVFPPFAQCPGGGIGRRDGLKIRFLRECGFDPHPGYHLMMSNLEKTKMRNRIRLDYQIDNLCEQ